MSIKLPIRNIYAKDKTLLARIISFRDINNQKETEFFSDKSEILQCGFINYEKDLKPDFHKHNPIKRTSIGTCEALYIIKGSGTLEIIESEVDEIQSEVVNEGDLINLVNGLHRIIPADSDLLMIEIKNGPYVSRERDKKFFKL